MNVNRRRGRSLDRSNLPITRSRYRQFSLNREKTLKKLCAASKRGPINIQNKSGNIVLDFNASTFMAFEQAATVVLQNHLFSKEKDSDGKVLAKVFKKTNDYATQYTLSLYRTTLRALVNGRHLTQFWDDLVSILSTAGFDVCGDGVVQSCPAGEMSMESDRTVMDVCSGCVHLPKMTQLSTQENDVIDDVTTDLFSSINCVDRQKQSNVADGCCWGITVSPAAPPGRTLLSPGSTSPAAPTHHSVATPLLPATCDQPQTQAASQHEAKKDERSIDGDNASAVLSLVPGSENGNCRSGSTVMEPTSVSPESPPPLSSVDPLLSSESSVQRTDPEPLSTKRDEASTFSTKASTIASLRNDDPDVAYPAVAAKLENQEKFSLQPGDENLTSLDSPLPSNGITFPQNQTVAPSILLSTQTGVEPTISQLQSLQSDLLDTKTQLTNKLKTQNKELASFMQDILGHIHKIQNDITSLQHTVQNLAVKQKFPKHPHVCVCKCQSTSPQTQKNTSEQRDTDNLQSTETNNTDPKQQIKRPCMKTSSDCSSQTDSIQKTHQIETSNSHCQNPETPSWSQPKTGQFIPANTKHLILGGSYLKSLQRKKICPQGSVQIKTLHHYEIDDLIEKLKANVTPQHTTKSVSFLIRGNETLDTASMLEQYKELSSVASKIFPNATIYLLALPLHNRSTKHIKKCNMAMAQVAKENPQVQYVTISNSANYKSDDGRQMTMAGTIHLAKSIRGYLHIPFPRPRNTQTTQLHKTKKSSGPWSSQSFPPQQKLTKEHHRRTLLPTPPFQYTHDPKKSETRQALSQTESHYNEEFPPLPHKQQSIYPDPIAQPKHPQYTPRTHTKIPQLGDRGTHATPAMPRHFYPNSMMPPFFPYHPFPFPYKQQSSQPDPIIQQRQPHDTPKTQTNIPQSDERDTHATPFMPRHLYPNSMMPPFFPYHPFPPYYPFMGWHGRTPMIQPEPTV